MAENIKQKLRKIMELANRGVDGERSTARTMLERLLKEYELTVEDLTTDEIRKYKISYYAAYEKKLLFQILFHVTQRKTLEYWTAGKGNTWITVELTPIQYHTVMDYWKTYRKPLRDQINTYIENLFQAYIEKHNLFGPGADEPGKPNEKLDPDLLHELKEHMQHIAKPVKQIEN